MVLLVLVDNFRAWCASRVVTLDREYAKQILNACAFSQSISEKERCGVGLDATREAAEQLGFVPREVSFERKYVQERVSRLSV